jgi:hypothetical protein
MTKYEPDRKAKKILKVKMCEKEKNHKIRHLTGIENEVKMGV